MDLSGRWCWCCRRWWLGPPTSFVGHAGLGSPASFRLVGSLAILLLMKSLCDCILECGCAAGCRGGGFTAASCVGANVQRRGRCGLAPSCAGWWAGCAAAWGWRVGCATGCCGGGAESSGSGCGASCVQRGSGGYACAVSWCWRGVGSSGSVCGASCVQREEGGYGRAVSWCWRGGGCHKEWLRPARVSVHGTGGGMGGDQVGAWVRPEMAVAWVQPS